MKKIVFAALIAAVAFLMSYMPRQPEEAKIGEEAPAISIAVDGNEINLKDYRGSNVLLNFWSKYDAPSRLANHQYARAAEASNGKLRFISICIDSDDDDLARMIAEQDGPDTGGRYFLSQLTPKDRSAAYANRTPGAWLIDSNGILIAHKPAGELLSAI